MAQLDFYRQQIQARNANNPNIGGIGRIGAYTERTADIVAKSATVMSERAERRAEEDAAIDAASKLAATQRQWMVRERELREEAMASGNVDGFSQRLLEEYEPYVQEQLSTAKTPRARAYLEERLASYGTQLFGAGMQFEADARVARTTQQAESTLEDLRVVLDQDPEQYAQSRETLGLVYAQLPPGPEREKAWQTASRTLAYQAALAEARRAPESVLAALDGKQGIQYVDDLDADSRVRLRAVVEGERQKLRNEAGVMLRYETANAEAMARAGVAPTGQQRTPQEFAAAFENPQVAEFEYARYRSAMLTAEAVALLKAKPTEDLVQVIQAKPDPKDPNFSLTSESFAIQARAAAEIVQARLQDPVAYAIQSGDFELQPLDPNDPAAFSDELKRRAAALPGMAEQYGAASVLAKNEAQQLAQGLALLPADQKVEQLESIRASISDDAVYSTVLNAIRPDSPVTALVGNIAAVGAGDNARMIAFGEDLLNPTKEAAGKAGKGAFPMPTESMMRQAWVASVGDAYRGYPDAESTAYQAYKAYYAAAAAQRGLNDPLAGPDDAIVFAAINAATGGVARWRTDWFGNDTPSANVILPYGMPEDQFLDSVAAEWNRRREDLGYANTDVGDIGLYNTGANGEYMVMAGQSWLPGPDGQPVIIKIGAD